MTTIAWDGKTLAADTLSLTAGLRRRVTKVFKLPAGRLFAGSGEYQNVLAAFQWFDKGEPTEKPKFNGDDFSCFVVSGGKCYRYENLLIPVECLEPFTATGSGRDYAIAAMHCGRTAKEAVEIACLYDANTGGPVECLTVED